MRLVNRVCTLSFEGFIDTQESIRRPNLLYDAVDSFFSCMSDEEGKKQRKEGLVPLEDTL